MNFRDLAADDIEIRVQSVKQNGLVLLLYKIIFLNLLLQLWK